MAPFSTLSTIWIGVIRTNGHHWTEYKIMPDASLVTSVNFTFECKAVKDCKVLFARRNDHTLKYLVYLGAYTNTRSIIDDNVRYVVDVLTPDIVSGVEFRKFWIHLDGNTINVGAGNDNSPAIMSYTDPSTTTRSFSHVSISTCCDDYGYWKIHSHPQFHEYPNGAYTVP
ncbi:uncharacterized protein LOC134778035 [Penaeus indicus]|uniref:uncharacterized protein LOC134778035 n=1 Tax=Penaeus indicus TaxID=29960 RepID=UPI00300CB240